MGLNDRYGMYQVLYNKFLQMYIHRYKNCVYDVLNIMFKK